MTGRFACALAAWLLALPAAAAELLIGSADLAAALAAGQRLALVDAETAERYGRAHIPGAVSLPHMELEDAAENAATGRPIFPTRAAQRFGAAGIAADTPVVVYDGGDGRAASAVWYVLKYVGHQDVRILDGGFRKWLAEGRAVTQAVPQVQKAVYKPGERQDWNIATARVAAGAFVVVDTRSIAEYSGKENGGAPRGGHIPGARSLPWDRLAGEVSTFAAPEAMRARLAEAGLTADQPILTYCNPGLGRSTFLLAAAALLGWDNVKVYPGSWLEWAGDPTRAIER